MILFCRQRKNNSHSRKLEFFDICTEIVRKNQKKKETSREPTPLLTPSSELGPKLRHRAGPPRPMKKADVAERERNERNKAN